MAKNKIFSSFCWKIVEDNPHILILSCAFFSQVCAPRYPRKARTYVALQPRGACFVLQNADDESVKVLPYDGKCLSLFFRFPNIPFSCYLSFSPCLSFCLSLAICLSPSFCLPVSLVLFCFSLPISNVFICDRVF